MDEYMRSIVRTTPAEAIIIDLLDYEYVYGNDVAALFMVGFDQQSRALLPVRVVAAGATRSGLESLLASSNFVSQGGLDVAVIPTMEEAQEAVIAMLKTAVQQPKTERVTPPGLSTTRSTAASAMDQRIHFPWLEAFVWLAVAATVTALLARTHTPVSLMSVGVVIVIGGLLTAANLSSLIRAWVGIGERETVHFLPLMGGVLLAIGIWRFPVDAAHRWWWTPLIIDPGCLLIAGSFIWERTFGKRAR
jgi:hypothetical protein